MVKSFPGRQAKRNKKRRREEAEEVAQRAEARGSAKDRCARGAVQEGTAQQKEVGGVICRQEGVCVWQESPAQSSV